MVARSAAECRIPEWKRELAAAFTRPEELFDALALEPDLFPATCAAAAGFPLRVPRGYASLMEKGNPRDPLLRQVLPLGEELADCAGFSADPVGDRAATRAPGLLRKYHGRALLMATGACAIHCRYCFRRHFRGAGARAGALAVAHLAADPSIAEVILSGGDPLLLDDPVLADLIGDLETIPHLERLRLHTRLPVALPSRVTPELCRILAGGRLTAVVVIHANHARELGEESRAALQRLRAAGIALLNQGVLLRGVNDRADDLADLSETLFANGVLPYYLHLLDRVAGAAHFEVTETAAQALLEALRTRLPGYLVPRLVREEPGRPYKIPLD